MKPFIVRRRAGGFTYIEVTAAFCVLVIGVLGFAGTVVYTRNLDRNTTQLWKASSAAGDALEDVREDSAGQWESLGDQWDNRDVETHAGGSTVNAELTATVSEDPAELDQGTGMWTSGQSRPNFYHVRMRSKSNLNLHKGALNFQTYVADRTGFRALIAGNYQGLPPVGSMGARLCKTPVAMVAGGTNHDNLTFKLTNTGSTPLAIRTVYAAGENIKFTQLVIGSQTLYNGSQIKSKTFTPTGLSLAAGLNDLRILSGNGKDWRNKEAKLKFTFTDGTSTTIEVEP